MIRKKKKRVAVTVKSPFRELALPFEGRRMLIRAEDLADKNSSARLNCSRPVADNNERGSPLFEEPDFYNNFESRSSTTAKSMVQFKDEQGHKAKGEISSVFNEDLPGSTEEHGKHAIGDNSNRKLLTTGVNQKNTDKTFEFFRILQKVNSRQRRNNSKQACNIKEPTSSEETVSQTVPKSPHSQDDGFCDSKSNHGKHQGTTNSRLKSQVPGESKVLDCSQHIPLKYSDLISSHEQQPVSGKLESCSKAGSCEAKSNSDKTIPYQIQMDVTPEGRNHRYHVRRVKHFVDNDSSKYSYVIHVSGESDLDQQRDEMEIQKSTKKRRGDIARGIFTKNSLKTESVVENPHQISECVSAKGKNGDVTSLSDGFRSSRSEGKTESTSVPKVTSRSDKTPKMAVVCSDESSSQRKRTNDISAKTKVSKRLIDHLQRKESLSQENQIQSASPVDYDDIYDANENQPVEEKSKKLIRTGSRKRNKKEDGHHLQLDDLSTLVPRKNTQKKEIYVREDDMTVNCETKESDVLLGLNPECNKNAKLEPLQDNDTFSGNFASANVNENRKHVNDIPDSKAFQSLSCHSRHTHTDDSESDPHTDPETENFYCYSQKNTNQKRKVNIFTGALERKRKNGVYSDFAKYYKGSTMSKSQEEICQYSKGDPATKGLSIRVQKVRDKFKERSSVDGAVKHKTSTEASAEIKTSNFSCNTEHSNLKRKEGYEPFNKKETTTRKYSQSPHHSPPPIKPIAFSGRKKQFSIDSASNNSQIFIDTPIQETENQNHRAFSQEMKSPILPHSPAMNIALQNENHSNRIKVNRESSLFPTGVPTRKTHRSKVPRFRHKIPEPDETGLTTFAELGKVLQDARANSIVRCTADKLQRGVQTPESIAEIEACVNSAFMGEYLRCLWTNQLLCDVKVEVGDEEILVHKLVLAAYSSVFCPPTPRPPPTIILQIGNSTPDAIRQLFSYMYTSKMALTDDILEPVINAAIVLGVLEVVDIVKGILSSPTMDNVNLYASIIKRVGLDISLLDQEKIYRHGFTDLRNNAVFLGISVDELEGILMDPEVMVTNEAETVEMIVSWIQYNYLQRIGCLDLLLRYVSFECIPPADLVELSEKYSHIFDTSAGNSFLCQAFKYHALNCRVPGPNPDETIQKVDGMSPRANVSTISIPQGSKILEPEGSQLEKEFPREEGLTAIRSSLWGQQMPIESDSFVTPGRISAPTAAANRSPSTSSRVSLHMLPVASMTSQANVVPIKGTQSAPSTTMLQGGQMTPRQRGELSSTMLQSGKITPRERGATSSTMLQGGQMTPRPRGVPSNQTSPDPARGRYSETSFTPARTVHSQIPLSDYRDAQNPIYSGYESYVSLRTQDQEQPGEKRYQPLNPARVTFSQQFRDSMEPPSTTLSQMSQGRNTNSYYHISRNNNATDEAIRYFLNEVTRFKPVVTKTGSHVRGLSMSHNGMRYKRGNLGSSIGGKLKEQLLSAGHGGQQCCLQNHFVANAHGINTRETLDLSESHKADKLVVSDNKTYREVHTSVRANRDTVSCAAEGREVEQSFFDEEVSPDNESNTRVVCVAESDKDVDESFRMYRQVEQNDMNYTDVIEETEANCVINNRRTKPVDRGAISNREINHNIVTERQVDAGTTSNDISHGAVGNRGVDVTSREMRLCASANRNIYGGTLSYIEAIRDRATCCDVEEDVQDESQISLSNNNYYTNDDMLELKFSEDTATLYSSSKERPNVKRKALGFCSCQSRVSGDNKCFSTDESNSRDFVVCDRSEPKTEQQWKPCTVSEHLSNYKSLDKNTNEKSLFLLNHNEETSAFEVYKPHI